jgi:hypothetical protein
VVDSAFLPFVRDLASDGMVPPWPQWWPDDVMSGLFPDEVTRRSVTREAAGRGWPVRELPGEHLHMLVRPADVATALIGLAAETATAT